MNPLSVLRTGFLTLLLAPASVASAQGREYVALVPTFHDRGNRSGIESALRLRRQECVLFVYHNAVAVYTEAEFVNEERDSLSWEFALPSTGHDENGDAPGGRLSSGILSVRLWVEGERTAPEIVREGAQDWYTIRSRFSPGGARTVKAMFWAQTSFTDVDSLPGLDTVVLGSGKRGFTVDLAHAGVWKGGIESVRFTVVLKEGISVDRDSVTAEPEGYERGDSTLTWTYRNIEPTLNDNINVSYAPRASGTSAEETLAGLAADIVRNAYDALLRYSTRLQER